MSSSSNLAAGQYRVSPRHLGTSLKESMKRYSPNIGPILLAGGQAIFSISRGITGLPRLVANVTCTVHIYIIYVISYNETFIIYVNKLNPVVILN